jgi:hypothetical protein
VSIPCYSRNTDLFLHYGQEFSCIFFLTKLPKWYSKNWMYINSSPRGNYPNTTIDHDCKQPEKSSRLKAWHLKSIVPNSRVHAGRFLVLFLSNLLRGAAGKILLCRGNHSIWVKNQSVRLVMSWRSCCGVSPVMDFLYPGMGLPSMADESPTGTREMLPHTSGLHLIQALHHS